MYNKEYPMQMNQQFTLQEPAQDFFENLLLKAPQNLYDVEAKISEMLDYEIQNRTAWFERIRQSIVSLGLTDIYTRSIQNPGNVKNTTYLECWLKLLNTYTSEIFQPMNLLTYEIKYLSFLNQNEELKAQINDLENLGKTSTEALNLNLCKRWSEFVPELKKIISSCFLTGGAVCKVFFDPTLRRPTLKLIEPENFIINPNASSLETAEEISHIFEIDEEKLNELQRNGIYLDVELSPNGEDSTNQAGSVERTRETVNNIKSRTQDDIVKKYRICETIFMAFPHEVGDEYGMQISGGCKMPYKTHFQLGTKIALMRKRCWYPNKEEITKKIDMVKFTYVQTMNFWGLGLIQLLENLHKNANSVQDSLDKAMKLAYEPTAIASSNITINQANMRIQPGFVNVFNGYNPGDMFHHIEFPQPTPIFMEYLNFIEGKMKTITSISQIKMESLPANIKASVLLSLMMEDSKSMSSVMRQMIQSLNELFEVVKQFMMNEMGERYFISKEFKLKNKDIFKEIIDYKSTADPNYSNQAMQVILYQTIFEYAAAHPELFKMDELYRRFFNVLKIVNIDEIMLTPEELQKQKQDQQTMVDQQNQMQQAQIQMQQEQMQTQNQLMDKELEITAQKNQMEAEIKQLTLETNKQLDALKVRHEEIHDKALLEQQNMIEDEKRKETILNYIIKMKELELKYGIQINIDPQKELNDA
jgi:hypothetical protein